MIDDLEPRVLRRDEARLLLLMTPTEHIGRACFAGEAWRHLDRPNPAQRPSHSEELVQRMIDGGLLTVSKAAHTMTMRKQGRPFGAYLSEEGQRRRKHLIDHSRLTTIANDQTDGEAA
ncbi:hypothetical protein ACFPIF_10375 [Brevundimonas faecalis]|uniref:hypothetical protein n=1 Tax=Brevundimonas faecalis TaxID=947378 RepID=UPI00360C7A0C